VVLCSVVWLAVVEKLGGGVVCVWVTVAVAVVTTALVALLVAAFDVELDVVVCVCVALALSGGTGALSGGPVIVACAPVPDSPDANDPDRAGADVDFTALPIPKPAATAITSNTPSSHLRRSIVTSSLHPVPPLIVVGRRPVSLRS
jgi:hypothetical protein